METDISQISLQCQGESGSESGWMRVGKSGVILGGQNSREHLGKGNPFITSAFGSPERCEPSREQLARVWGSCQFPESHSPGDTLKPNAARKCSGSGSVGSGGSMELWLGAGCGTGLEPVRSS